MYLNVVVKYIRVLYVFKNITNLLIYFKNIIDIDIVWISYYAHNVAFYENRKQFHVCQQKLNKFSLEKKGICNIS